jgi:hypothetical protein
VTLADAVLAALRGVPLGWGGSRVGGVVKVYAARGAGRNGR